MSRGIAYSFDSVQDNRHRDSYWKTQRKIRCSRDTKQEGHNSGDGNAENNESKSVARECLSNDQPIKKYMQR